MVEVLRTFFELNRDLVFFLYGLTFFVLGLAIALQSRVFSRLELSRSLTWLSVFGFTHGFHEWGDYFVPIQAAYLSDVVVGWLINLRLLLLAISFAALFVFGLRLLQPLGVSRELHVIPATLLASWIFVSFFLLPVCCPPRESWIRLADAAARYFIGFPAGLVAAYALRRHTLERIEPFNAPHIVRTLQTAGLLLFGYAVLGGLIPPAIPVFPGNVINNHTFEQVLIVPPMVFRSILGLALAIAIIRALEIFDLEIVRRIDSMEQQQLLAAERERLARELHDGAIQKVYTAGLLVQAARDQAADSILSDRLDRAMGVMNDAISDLRRHLTELSGGVEKIDLAEHLQALAADDRYTSLVDVELSLALPPGEDFAPDSAGHVLAIAQEALSNVLRHAQATRVTIRATKSDGSLELVLRDNGVGMPPKHEAGYGLRNMRDRARLLNGVLEVTAAPEGGTVVRLTAPWENDQ